ncbi:hypothetical protein LTS17_008219 [Exophiala oligosperma]
MRRQDLVVSSNIGESCNDLGVADAGAGIPLFGNLFQIPPHHSWLKFKEWADQYGSIYQLNIAGRKHVVLSTEKIANELLRERGSIYSSREQLAFASELLSNNLRPLLLPYNELWRRGRKLMHQLTMPVAADSYQPVQEIESIKLLSRILREPSKYEQWFEQYASGVVFRIGFGRWIKTGQEEEFQRIITVGKNVERVASPGTYLVDSIPLLKHLPTGLAPFKQEALQLRTEELSLFRKLQNDVRETMKTKDVPESFTKTFLENQEAYKLSDDEGAYVIGTLFEAGSGTTAAAMMSFCLAMCLHPEWQTKVQKEVDEVAKTRMPNFDDMAELPTVRAVIKEVLRWRPVTAGGVPHQLIQDDTYQGFSFSEGTVFHANQWAIHRDPALYPDPESFRPERWLSPEFPQTYREPLTKYPNLQNYSCFGFGRRICPGQNIAERSMNILGARIAWALDLRRKIDTDGKAVSIPDYDYTIGFNVQPRYFDFDIFARSPERATIVAQALREVTKETS